MSDCPNTVIEITPPTSHVVIEQGETCYLEFEVNKTYIEFNDCPGDTVDLTTGNFAPITIEMESTHTDVIEVFRDPIYLEFPECIVINEAPDAGAGSNIVCEYEASEVINTNRVVVILPDGTVRHADKDDFTTVCDVIGISRQSAAQGALVEIVKFGKLLGVSTFPISANLWLGNNGAILTTAPTSGALLSVGTQTANSELNVKIGRPIIRN